jgi:flavin-dependent dehydrogenase
MAIELLDVDMAVLGAGSAGSAAAWALAGAGFRVMLLEARALDEAGASWANLVPVWPFSESGVGVPQHPELLEEDRSYTMLSRTGPGRSVVSGDKPFVHIDCRLWMKRIHGMAVDRGVEFRDRVARVEVLMVGDRLTALQVVQRSPDGRESRLEVRARLFVDASGIAGVLRRQVPVMQADCPEPSAQRGELCSGANEICEIVDRPRAREFLVRQDLQPGDTAVWTGVSGGYSTIVAHVRERLDSILITTGAIADGRHGSGIEVLRDFKTRHPWIGRGIFGGAGLIPIRRPYDRLGAPGLVLVGDAACQVFPGHASGIGAGLMAARCLADVMQGRTDPGSEESVWAYQSHYHRGAGAFPGSFDAFRILSVSMSEQDVGNLIGGGLMQESAVRTALGQRMTMPNPREAPVLVQAVLKNPKLAARVGQAAARMGTLAVLYRAHPDKPDRAALKRWSRAVAFASGGTPDVV